MKKFTFLFFLWSALAYSQKDKFFKLNDVDLQSLKTLLISKKLEVRDTIFIKYDYNNDYCWEMLDLTSSDENIRGLVKTFQTQIANFNGNHKDAVAYNFREPGKKLSKLKLWDETIIIDDNRILKKLLFKKNRLCGNSAIIFSDGSYVLKLSDPHFESLPANKKRF